MGGVPDRFTLVSFHAHPDDESLLTGGTLARAAAEGHRVVLVTATDGAAGLAAAEFGTGATLASHRDTELDAAAAALGVARVVRLGHADSGLQGEVSGPTFVQADVHAVAERLVEVLAEEGADVLTGYDARGGYGHPDHVMVHRVARRAAALAAQRGLLGGAGQPVRLLEATIDRTLMAGAVRWGERLRLVPKDAGLHGISRAYSARDELTHRVDVRAHCAAKRAGLEAHASQATGGGSTGRTITGLLRLPGPLFRAVLGHEWFVEVGREPRRPLLDDIFASLRS